MNFFKNLTKIFKSINSKNLEKAGPNNLDISPNLIDFAENELLPGLNISSEYFWKTFENILEKFTQRNIELLEERKNIQKQLDNWYIQNKDISFDLNTYKTFLEKYLTCILLFSAKIDSEFRKYNFSEL